TSINDVLTASGTTIGQATYTITPISNGCPGTPETVTVTVYPSPVVTASVASLNLCSGETTDIILTSNVPGTTFSWSVLPTGVIGALPDSGSSINQTLTTVGMTQGTVVYTITPMVNGCVGQSIDVTITVNPTPELFSSSNPPPICSGLSSGIIVTPNIPGTTIEWTVVQSGVAGAFDGSGSEVTPGAGIPISQVLTTTGNTQGTATYTITPINNGCAGEKITVVVTVNPLPSIDIPDGIVCIDSVTGSLIYGYTMDTELSAADYDFQWYFGSDMSTVIATGSSYVATEAGLYTVSIMNAVTGCTEVFMINVTESNPAQSATAVVTNYFEDSQAITVTVAGTGSYLYSLDGGAFQTSNVFLHVLPGEHTVTIQDAIGCTDITLVNILTIGYPHFFTPNGDGHNDTWNVWSLSGNQPNSEIQIFDRYGKLIKQIVPAGSGWDGTYNGQLLPSTDYWFTIKYMENGAEKEFRAHFSMKR
ncbi:T9SS type B sorting domain-containing protein, partial [Flavobacterium limnosediminis]|uniref:T9SS type B sorting domain-containing protein n=1 Tax=Flavobacterium limnosediminis TaxID=1401027 RepID=UPI0005514287